MSQWSKFWQQLTLADHPLLPTLSHSTIALQEAQTIAGKVEGTGGKQPITVNICGFSGLGKTTLTNKIGEYLRTKGYSVATLREEDGAHDRSVRLAMSLSGINPLSFDLDLLLTHYLLLGSGQVAQIRGYDHISGTLSGAYRLEKPSTCILLDGSIWRQQYLSLQIPVQHIILLFPKSLFLWKDAMMQRDRRERNYSLHQARTNFRNYLRDFDNHMPELGARYDSLCVLKRISNQEYFYWYITDQVPRII